MTRERLNADVAVVGGGTIGLCTAYYLHRAGVRPIVIERKRPGAGSSLRNAGYVSPSHFVPLAAPGIVARGLRWMLNPSSPFYIKPRIDPDLIRWGLLFWRSATRSHVQNSMRLLFDLCIRSLRLYEQMAERDGLQFDLERKGIVNLFRSDRGKTAAAEEAELSSHVGFPATLLDRDGLQRLQPGIDFRATGGLYFPEDSHIDPEKFLAAITERLLGEGVRILTDEEVTGISTGSPARVTTRQKEIQADTVVIAGGAWSAGLARMLGMRLLVQAGKGYSLTIPRPPHCPTIPMILTESRVALTPFADTFRLGGTMELAGLDLSVTPRRVRAIIDSIPLYLANVDVNAARHEQPWAGLRPVSPDGLPYLGRLKRHPNVIAATGHAMIGVTLAPVTGHLVTELVTAASTSLPIGALDPDRFH
jgi:D-amino-acid dehydrogenase